MATVAKTWTCPKCRKPAGLVGEVVEDGRRGDVYQCEGESCQVSWDFDGASFPAAYTFVVGPDGVPRDPAEPFDPTVN